MCLAYPAQRKEALVLLHQRVARLRQYSHQVFDSKMINAGDNRQAADEFGYEAVFDKICANGIQLQRFRQSRVFIL